MYQSLLPILQPLIFEERSGTLQVTYRYNDQAQIFLKDGIIEQIKTNNSHGLNAMATCAQWVNISPRFQEEKSGEYTVEPAIETSAFLAFLEKTSQHIETIKQHIPNDHAIFCIDSDKLSKSDKLSADDFKIALLFDGKRTVQEILSMSDKSELMILLHTCRLLLSGIANQKAEKDVMPLEEQEPFLQSLSDRLSYLVGPASSILIKDAFEEINSLPDMLTREEIPLLLTTINNYLNEDERAQFDLSAFNYT